MNKETEQTISYYAPRVQAEWDRVVRDAYHRLEFDTTMRFLRQYLPGKGLVLDAGGGPGRYTIELARLGYDLVLLDLLPEHLTFAREQIEKARVGTRVKDVTRGAITDLSRYPDATFDAVICLGGPVCHVAPHAARRRAVRELARVAKPGAPVFISVMGQYGALMVAPSQFPQAFADAPLVDDWLATGDDYHFGGTGYCRFFTATEFRRLVSRKGLQLLQMVGLEGVNSNQATTNEFAQKYPDAWRKWLEIHNRICTEPFAIEASGHMMIVARKQ